MFLKPIVLSFLISLCLPVILSAQINKGEKIKSVSYLGITKIKPKYLDQFIESKIGTHRNDSLLREDVQRLRNISGVGDATYTIAHIDEETANLIFTIDEVKTLLPIVNFGGVKKNNWFRLGVFDANFMGNGAFLSAIYQNRNSRHGGQLYYRVSRIKGTEWGASASLNRHASIEPLFFQQGAVQYKYTNDEFAFSIFKQFGYRNKVEFGSTYFIEKYERTLDQNTEIINTPEFLRQPKYLLKTEITNDYLNYHFFYVEGFFLRTSLHNVYNTDDNNWFNSVDISAKYFLKIGDLDNVAVRINAGFASNFDTPFAPYVVDSHVNLRGAGNRIARGTAQLVANIELRHTIFENDIWGFQVLAFIDIGSLRNPGGQFNELVNTNRIQQYLGNGFRLINKKIYGAILRIDYGINIQNIDQRGVIIGLGQYF